MLLQPEIDRFLRKTYDTYCYLWSDEMEEMLKTFADTNPLTIEISDKFSSYDNITNDLQNANKIKNIDVIEIHMDDIFDEFIEYSKDWKETLGNYLSVMYKKKLSEFVTFISDVEFVLHRKLNDLDDVRVAMDCLRKIREHSIE